MTEPAALFALPAAPESLLARHRHDGPGYRPLVDYGAWRVAILRFAEDLRAEAITRMQRHNETDEVFVLLFGRCLLFTASGTDGVEEIFAEDLQPHVIYNVRRGVWHHHALSRDAEVLVVENRETTYDNSPFTDLNAAQQEKLVGLCRRAWGETAEAP